MITKEKDQEEPRPNSREDLGYVPDNPDTSRKIREYLFRKRSPKSLEIKYMADIKRGLKEKPIINDEDIPKILTYLKLRERIKHPKNVRNKNLMLAWLNALKVSGVNIPIDYEKFDAYQLSVLYNVVFSEIRENGLVKKLS